MRIHWLVGTVLLVASTAWSQEIPDFLLQEPKSMGAGWAGFTDIGFMVNALLTLTLAAVLGAIIAYHPRHGKATDTMAEIEAPKVFIMYSVIGSIIGIMVVKYGLVVGFVLFGIGGLIRFRTVLRSASLTGHVIFVTLIGLSCGLDLPHVAVLATAFAFILIYVLNSRATFRIDVRGLPPGHVVEAAAAYRALLAEQGYHIMSERKNPKKKRVQFLVQSSQEETAGTLEEVLELKIDPALKGAVDIEID
jgi:hypothetical protein